MKTRLTTLALLVIFQTLSFRVGAAQTVPADPPDDADQVLEPSTPAPTQPPPPSPRQIPNPPASPAQVPAPTQPTGQWVYTDQYGWVWMPYGNQYTNVPADGTAPNMYVYYPAQGWCWMAAPWVWGWGPMPFFGVLGPVRFGWWGNGFGHWYGFSGRYGSWGRPGVGSRLPGAWRGRPGAGWVSGRGGGRWGGGRGLGGGGVHVFNRVH